MDWTAFSAIINSVLAIVTVGVLLVNRQQVKASREQSESSIKQVNLMREQLVQSQKQVQGTLEASQRPFLFPTEPFDLSIDVKGKRVFFDFDKGNDDVEDEITLQNGGTGIAVNIMGYVVEPRPSDKALMENPPRFNLFVMDRPLPPGEETETILRKVTKGRLQWDSLIGNKPDNFASAPAPTKAYNAVLRLSILYSDIFGQGYASQFDLRRNGKWEFHWFGKEDPNAELFERLQATLSSEPSAP